MTNFEKWNNAFQSNNLSAFNHNEKALLYLKVRAICRGKLIKQFTEKYQLELKSTKVKNQFSPHENGRKHNYYAGSIKEKPSKIS